MTTNPQIYRDMGLNDTEYAQIVQTLGREPNVTELGMYAVMWSEHCGYKYSRPVLKLFKRYREAMDTGAVENAGVIDIGDGVGIVMKMESHNHPSAVEPFQGAATGVGGILRDIFTMGARPIASLNSLRFGPLDDARTRYLFEGVVGGISHYGNCLAPDETFIWRDDGGVHFDTIGKFVEARLGFGNDTRELNGRIETLSMQPETRESCWRPVRRIFKRRTRELIRIGLPRGRTLTVTPDHPMLSLDVDWSQPNSEWNAASDEHSISYPAADGVKLAGTLCQGQRLYAFSFAQQAEQTQFSVSTSHRAGSTGIRKIERIIVEGGCDVYDVEVDDTHLFVTTDGVVVHNCVGVPTVGGEIYFHPSYAGNPLVNAMAVGVVDTNKIASAAALGVGNPVLFVGSATGRDGIHGATFASVELGPDSESKRPNVQMGDPFAEKLLIEATLEALATGHVVGIQDMGAAGLTCSTCEMSAKAGLGMTIDVRKVPLREATMTPYEIMLSESQERMLAVIEKGFEDAIAAVFHKWGLNAVVIGEVTDTGRVVILDNGIVAADVPGKSLTDDCPVYSLDAAEPSYIRDVQSADLSKLPEPDDYGDVLLKLLASPSIASKRWVYEQYDSMVQTQTIVLPGDADAAVLRLRETGGKGIALTTDCNPRYCWLNPYRGAQIAVAEAARNLSCVGATPLAVTDCLNFPNPEKPEGFWQFRRAVEGLADACEAFAAPVISGNVSFYNETPDRAIFPTPTVGMVGLLPDAEKRVTMGFKDEFDLIYLIGGGKPTLGGSEYLSVMHGMEVGEPPELDLDEEKRVQAFVRDAIDKGLLKSAHDVSDGGLAVTLAECCIAGNLGAEVTVNCDLEKHLMPIKTSRTLFGERTASIVVSVRPARKASFLDLAKEYGVLKTISVQNMTQVTGFLGEVGGQNLKVTNNDYGRGRERKPINYSVAEMRAAYEGAIPAAMGKATH